MGWGREERQAVWRARAGGGVKVLGGRVECSEVAVVVEIVAESPQNGLCVLK